MPDQLQLRGGTTAQNDAFTGAAREVTVDTTKNTLIVHNNVDAGGAPLLREDGANSELILGSAATPSLKFTGDTNTGIFSPGADQVAVSTGGTERVEFGASEVVFNDGGADYDFRVEGDTNANLLVVDASTDRVGVGVASPGRYLDVQYSDSTAYSGTSQLTDTVRIFNTNSTTGSYSALELAATNANGAVNQWTLANISSGTNFQGDLAFHRRTSTAGWSEALRIDSSGRLLVGTSSSSANIGLAVQANSGDTEGTGVLFLQRGLAHGSIGESSTVGRIGFTDNAGNEFARVAGAKNGTSGTDDYPGALVFSTTADGAASPTERMRIDSNGVLISSHATINGGVIGTNGNELRLQSDINANGTPFTSFYTGSSERMRIDSSGRLLVGTSSTSAVLRAIFEATSGGSGGGTVLISRGTSTPTTNQTLGELQFADSNHGAAAVVIAKRDAGTWTSGSSQPSRLEFSTTADGASSPTERMRITSAGSVRPGADDTQLLGSGSFRWNQLYAGTATINTSDAGLKQDIEDLEQAELNVATAIKGLIKKYRFIKAVEEKGDDARIHVGVIAQDVEQAFIAEGLDPRRYALFCEDTLEDGTKRLGIRYSELLAFVIAAL